MKKFIVSVFLCAGALLTTGCHKEYLEQIENLKQRAADLKEACILLNENIAAIQEMASAMESNDLITSVTKMTEGDVFTGYKINFLHHTPITIYNGINGKVPVISSRQDSSDGHSYWFVQYGDEKGSWLLDENGNRILSVGLTPQFRITDGYWYYTYNGTYWTKLGKATGENGDTMFGSFNVTSEYVEFKMADGSVIKMPTYLTYTFLKNDADLLNSNTNALVSLMEAYLDKLTYIKEVAPVKSGNDTVGTKVSLSNGKSFTVYDFVASTVPYIYSKRDTDGECYWAVKYGELPDSWILNSEGKKILSESGISQEAPLIGVTHHTDGNYYWTATLGGKDTLFRYYLSGMGYFPHAIDSVVNGVITKVKDTTDYVVFEMKSDGRQIRLPKEYTASIKAEGKEVTDVIYMSRASSLTLNYEVFGPKATVTAMTQGGFTATVNANAKTIVVKAPVSFVDGTGKIVIMFTYETGSSPVSVVKTISIAASDKL